MSGASIPAWTVWARLRCRQATSGPIFRTIRRSDTAGGRVAFSLRIPRCRRSETEDRMSPSSAVLAYA